MSKVFNFARKAEEVGGLSMRTSSTTAFVGRKDRENRSCCGPRQIRPVEL